MSAVVMVSDHRPLVHMHTCLQRRCFYRTCSRAGGTGQSHRARTCCSTQLPHYIPLCTPPPHRMRQAVVLRVFKQYLDLMRKVQTTYWLEPAGSHGVWGLDDYQMLPFLWGASQLLAHPVIKPKSIHSAAVMEAHAHDYLYLAAVQFVKQVRWRWLHKKGGGAGLPLHPCPPSPPLLPGRSGLRFSEVQAPLRTQQRKNRRPFNVGYGAECGRAMRALLQTDAFQMCVWCGGGYASGAANRRPSNVSLVWGGYASAAANRRPSNVCLVWEGYGSAAANRDPKNRRTKMFSPLTNLCTALPPHTLQTRRCKHP